MPFKKFKRNHPRWVVTSWTLRYKEVDGAGADEGFITASLVNVSRGGICFDCDHEYEQGVRLDLELTSKAFPAPIVAQGHVMWCRRSKVTQDFEIGVEFGEVAWDSMTKATAQT